MQRFETKSGAAFSLTLNVQRVDTILRRTGIDLLSTDYAKTFVELTTNVRDRLAVIWEMVDDKDRIELRPDPDKPGEMYGPMESFFDQLDGSDLSAADEAFWQEIDFFFRSSNPAVATAIEKVRQQMGKISAKQIETIGRIVDDPKMTQALDREMAKIQAEALSTLDGGSSN